jgi:hypothetical protein
MFDWVIALSAFSTTLFWIFVIEPIHKYRIKNYVYSPKDDSFDALRALLKNLFRKVKENHSSCNHQKRR